MTGPRSIGKAAAIRSREIADPCAAVVVRDAAS